MTGGAGNDLAFGRSGSDVIGDSMPGDLPVDLRGDQGRNAVDDGAGNDQCSQPTGGHGCDSAPRR
jgi:hypothetical protein